jgi:hypothetical protein
MNKTVLYLTVFLAIVGASIGGYYVITHTQALRVEIAPPMSVKPDDTGAAPAPKPNHGNFEQRFQPKPPSPNGGKLN